MTLCAVKLRKSSIVRGTFLPIRMSNHLSYVKFMFGKFILCNERIIPQNSKNPSYNVKP